MISAELPDGRQFAVATEVFEKFPQAAIGYLVADIVVTDTKFDRQAELEASLAATGITRETLGAQPQIRGWRETYKTFGVKPSDYRSSVEALTRRVLSGKPAHVNSVVDIYNYVSVKHLLPMGAMDMDQLAGDITVRYGREGETAHLFGMEPVPVTQKQIVYADTQRVISWLWNYRDAKETAVTLDTKRAFFIIDSLDGAAPIQAALLELGELLERTAQATVRQTGILC